MKKNIPVIFLLLWCFSVVRSQTPDTTRLKNTVQALTSIQARQNWLHSIFVRDQKYRGGRSIDSLDFLNLLSVCCFVNHFGYPDRKTYGDDANVAWATWIHNHRKLKIIAFPIILKGFVAGDIRERDVRDYYLRTPYLYRFDDEGYLNLPLRELFEKLDLNTGASIPLQDLMAAHEAITAFEREPKRTIGTWKSEPVSKSYDSGGKKVTVQFESERADLYALPDGRMFLSFSSSYGRSEPQELIRSAENEYRYKTLQSEKCWATEGGKLLLMEKTVVVSTFHLIEGTQK